MDKMNIKDIVNNVGFEDLDVMIELLKHKKLQQTAGTIFRNVFDRGYLIEVQYDTNCLVYVDRLINVDTPGNKVVYTFGIFGSEGELTLSFITNLQEINFSQKNPSQLINGTIFFNDNKEVLHTGHAFVICKLQRGVYDANSPVTVLESQTLRSLAKIRDKAKDAGDKKQEKTINNAACASKNSCSEDDLCNQEKIEKVKANEMAPHANTLKEVIDAIGSWLACTNGKKMNARRIITDIDTKSFRKKDGVSMTRRNNLSMSFKSIFFDSSKNAIVFGINAVDSIDEVGSNSYRFDVEDNEQFDIIWYKKKAHLEIKSKDGNQMFKIRFMESNGSFIDNFYKTIERFITIV